MTDMIDEGQPTAPSRARLPHVVLDRGSRLFKARKIVALIGEERFRSARRILEIGCGSGVIASTMALLGGEGVTVDAVDVVDSRLESAGFRFHLVEGTKLPFEDGCFDVVVTNHVIEHVGDRTAQLAHLGEIRRVLAPGGVVYLAVPNKWRLLEPHFRLPLLSWLPAVLADRYVRATGRGTYYDCVPLAHGEAIELFDDGGFHSQGKTVDALRATLEIEFPRSRVASWIRTRVPSTVIALGMCIMPTYVFLLKPKQPQPGRREAGVSP